MVLAQMDIARAALAQAQSIEEVWDIQNQANAALKILKSQRDSSFEMQNRAAELKVRAERKLGEITRDMAKAQGKRTDLPLSNTVLLSPEESPQTYADLGLEKMAVSRWQAIASVPEERFEEFIENVKAAQEEITSTAIIKEAQKIKRSANIREVPDFPVNTYGLIYADPPWEYEHSISDSRQIENQYPTMPLDAICNLTDTGGNSVQTCFAPDSVLFLWATSPKLTEALEVVEAWGFNYRTCAVWVKDRIGMGYYFRQAHELLLVAAKGSLPTPEPSNRQSSVITAPRTQHSAKPPQVYDLIESMYPSTPKIELFARNSREGWASWGNTQLVEG